MSPSPATLNRLQSPLQEAKTLLDESVRSISSAVQGMYEAFPYPDYNLFIPLRWQEAYASGSLFARQLLRYRLGCSPPVLTPPRILVAGCGDVEASIISRWEPRSHEIVGIDLSRRSLRKARWRSRIMLRPLTFLQMNLEDSQRPLPGLFQHIDAYGVLHHLANPAAALQRLSASLNPGGTMRIMVYNSRARQWIFQIQRVFALLGLSAYDRQDLRQARQLLQLFSQLPALTDRLAAMQPIIQDPARLVDAFFHEREARLGLRYWLKAIEQADLQALGIMDRYAELDDLGNPLLQMPKTQDWAERIDDLRFENNLEIYLWKKLWINSAESSPKACYSAPFALRRRGPPGAWFRYTETRDLSLAIKWQLWQAFLTTQFGPALRPLDRLCLRIPDSALQRLSRIGALFPDQVQSRQLQKLMESPMQPHMEVPQLPAALDLGDFKSLHQRLEAILLQKRLPLDRMHLILKRIMKAQSA